LLQKVEPTGLYGTSPVPPPPTDSALSPEAIHEVYQRRAGVPTVGTVGASMGLNPTSQLASSKARQAVPAAAVVKTSEVWLSSTTRLVDVCAAGVRQYAAAVGGADTGCVHVVESASGGHAGLNLGDDPTDATATAAGGGAKGGGRGLAAVLVWQNGPLRAGSARRVAALTQRVLCSVESRDWLVERTDGRGMQAMSLAEAEVRPAEPFCNPYFQPPMRPLSLTPVCVCVYVVWSLAGSASQQRLGPQDPRGLRQHEGLGQRHYHRHQCRRGRRGASVRADPRLGREGGGRAAAAHPVRHGV